MVFGVIAWLFAFKRINTPSLIHLIAALVVPIGIGTLTDRVGYGRWIFAPWNYISYNLLQNHSLAMDTSPFWDYFRRSITEAWPLIGFLTLLSFLIAWIKNPKHILTWCMLPFFAAHLIIGHKELRFLFPLAHAGGILLTLAISSFIQEENGLSKIHPLLIRSAARLILILNFSGLIALTFFPAWMPIRFYEQLYKIKPLTIYYQDDRFFNLGGAIMNFYIPRQTALVQVKAFSEMIEILKKRHETTWYFQPNPLPLKTEEAVRAYCQVEFSTLPAWIQEPFPLFFSQSLFRRATNWTLYRCDSLAQR